MVNGAISEMMFASANTPVQPAVYSRYSSLLTPGCLPRAIHTRELQPMRLRHFEDNPEALGYLDVPSEVMKNMHSMSNSSDSVGRPGSGSSDGVGSTLKRLSGL